MQKFGPLSLIPQYHFRYNNCFFNLCFPLQNHQRSQTCMEVSLTICCRIKTIWVEVPYSLSLTNSPNTGTYTLLYHENRVWEGYLPHKKTAQTHLSSVKAVTDLFTHSSADGGISDNPTCRCEQCLICCRRAH